MTGPIGLAFRMFDACVGIIFSVAVSVGALALFLMGGPPKQYEIAAMGSAYTSVLETLEGAARDLREDYCAKADYETRQQARCSSAASATEVAR